MFLRILLGRILTVLLPVSIVSTVYLYLYPIFHGCAFPLPAREIESSPFVSTAFVNTFLQHVSPDSIRHGDNPTPAVFRLLVLADPQIEGDSSLPGPGDEFIPHLRRHWAAVISAVRGGNSTNEGESSLGFDHVSFLSAARNATRTIILDGLPSALRAARKRLDLFGNDYYLAHIYRTLYWWSQPTHVTVLGDLIGSQWVSDEEFEQRGWRFWNRVFRGGERVSDNVTITGKRRRDQNGGAQEQQSDLETLQRYDSLWAKKIINVAGNHDIGYAGDVSDARLERFERAFGRPDWDVRFQHPLEDISNSTASVPTLHIINLNDLTLDTPPLVQSIQSDSYTYLNDLITRRSYPVEDRTSFTLLLTHVPLHKRAGVCTDSPHFTFHDEDDQNGEDDIPRFKKGGLREQNHLSDHVSASGILEGIFGMSGNKDVAGGGWGRNGLILTGHDHTGCDVIHFVNRSSAINANVDAGEAETEGEEDHTETPKLSWHWDATRYTTSGLSSQDSPSIREVTLRSMMGEYGGNAGLLSIWFDADPSVHEWQYDIRMCAAGVQHIWWTIHGLGLGVCIGSILVGILWISELWLGSRGRATQAKTDNKRQATGFPR